MSTIVSAEVKKRLNVSGGLYTLALELADTANHNGEQIFKSAGTLAKLTRQGERTVHRQLRQLRDVGWLVMVRRKHSARYPQPLYRIAGEWLRGANLASLPDLSIETCQPEPAELPVATPRVATGGNQSVHNHPKKISTPELTASSAPARASPSGSRGAPRHVTKKLSGTAEPIAVRVAKAKKLFAAHPDHPPKAMKRMFLLNDEQLAQVMAS